MRKSLLAVWAFVKTNGGGILAILAFIISIPTAWATWRSVEVANAGIDLAREAQATQARSELLSRQPNVEIEHPEFGRVVLKNYGPGVADVYFSRFYFELKDGDADVGAGEEPNPGGLNATGVPGMDWAYIEIANGIQNDPATYIPWYFDRILTEFPDATASLDGKPVNVFGPVGMILPGEGRAIYQMFDLAPAEGNAFSKVFNNTNIQICVTDLTGEILQNKVRGDLPAEVLQPCPQP